MACWLFKSEPATWSWTQQVDAGAKGTFWNGVRNHLAKKHMMAMKKGDEVVVLPSGMTSKIAGIGCFSDIVIKKGELVRVFSPEDSRWIPLKKAHK